MQRYQSHDFPIRPPRASEPALWKFSRKDECVCYLRHLWPQVDLSEVDRLRQEVVEQLTEQDAVPQGLSQVAHLVSEESHNVGAAGLARHG